jgi:hypothetical protein
MNRRVILSSTLLGGLKKVVQWIFNRGPGKMSEVGLPNLRNSPHAQTTKKKFYGEEDLSPLRLLSLGMPGLQKTADFERA